MAEFRWTAEQAAALIEPGNLVLSANAGTGKTRTIIGKIAWRLGLDVGVGPDGRPIEPCPSPITLDEVAAITFTEKAACELKERLREEIEGCARADRLRWELERASVGTIHAFCASLLRDHALRLGIDPSFRVLDERESALRLNEIVRDEIIDAVHRGEPEIERLLERFGLYDGRHTTGLIGAVSSVVREVRWHTERYEKWLTESTVDGAQQLDVERLLVRRYDETPDADEVSSEAETIRLAAGLYDLARRAVHAWLDWMEEENVRDFDSLILDVRRLLTRPEHRPALETIRAGLKILVIDEFQDTDGAQRDIAFALAGIGEEPAPTAPQLVLVGDPKQSIYGFRGADVRVWNEVIVRLCGERPPLELTENFRTQPGLVEFINRASGAAIESTGATLRQLEPELAIPYSALTSHREAGAGQGIDWLDCSGAGNADERRDLEARLVVSRIRALLDGGRLIDPAAAEDERPIRPADIAVLSRTRKGLEAVDRALKEANLPVYNAASLGLSARQEVLDMVTVLRLIANPEDDYHACAFLRSPFVGLRDEVIARIRVGPAASGGSLFAQAAAHLQRWDRQGQGRPGRADWFEAPEHVEIGRVEREALERALASVDAAQALVNRVSASELVDGILRDTGYRLHLLLRPGAEEALAAMDRFLALLDEYRGLPVTRFLDLWDRWGEQDLGIPQAPLFSAADDVVTLQTIHTAKGLEWPVVILVGAGDGSWDRQTDSYVTDPDLGPILMPRKRDRGAVARRIAERAAAAEQAEEARLLYVALTRARDRLVIAAPEVERGYMEYMLPLVRDAISPHLVTNDSGRAPRRAASRAKAEDPVTRTGGQIEVFPEDAGGQLDIFRHVPSCSEPKREESAGRLVPVVYRVVDAEQRSIDPIPVALDWMDDLETAPIPVLARDLDPQRTRSLISATELQMQAADPDAWLLRYVHGVQEPWRFAPRPVDRNELPATLRGVLIHGVLERIRAVDELAGLLDETIADVEAPPGVEEMLEPGTAYRRALEAEIARVVTGEKWRWYVSGSHYRELPFLVLAGGRPWRTGAIDLFRPGSEPWIIDFKTHRIDAAEVESTAGDYAVQAAVYQAAASALTRRTPRMLFHFTHPDETVEV